MARYYFNISLWKPSRTQWMLAGQCIQEEERKRVSEFVFKEDCKAALVGRVLLRYLLTVSTKVQWNSIHLARTDKGKPVVDNLKTSRSTLATIKDFSFNISHSGDYVVAVADRSEQVGVDVMKTTDRQGGVEKFFGLMSRYFTEKEWTTIKSQAGDAEKMVMFYRHWCLKESFVKAIGKGIGYSLQKLSFDVDGASRLNENELYDRTKLYIDGELATNWIFEQTNVGDDHCVAIATDVSDCDGNLQMISKLITEVKFEEMEDSMQKISTCDDDFWSLFEKKLTKNR